MNTDTVNRAWKVKPLAGALGAEVKGIKLAQTKDTDIVHVKQLLEKHMVLFFPMQFLKKKEHVSLGKKFGLLEGHPNLKDSSALDHPEIFELRSSKGGIADEWHTDLTFQAEPALMSILNMVRCPKIGGDTIWSNLCAAFDALSLPIQEMCVGLSALHDAHPHNRADKMAIHPVVRKHPETGRNVLYVNEHFTRRIVEMGPLESENFLKFLTSWIQNPRFTVRYSWSEGTICMWDNRCTQHYVINDFIEERIIQRVTVMGDKPKGTSPKWPPHINRHNASAMSRHDRQLAKFLKNREKILG